MAEYRPQPAGDFATIEDLVEYLERELNNLAQAVAFGRFTTIRLDQLNSFDQLPRPRDGDVAYFTDAAAGVNQHGVYEFDEQTSAWKKL